MTASSRLRRGDRATQADSAAAQRHGKRSFDSGHSWRTTAAAALAAFAGAASLLLVTAPREPRHADACSARGGIERRAAHRDRDRWCRSAVIDELAPPAVCRRFQGCCVAPARGWHSKTHPPRPIPLGYGPPWRRVRRRTCTASVDWKRGGSQACTARWRPASRRLSSRSLRGATDLLRLTRPSVASGNERRVKTLWEVADDSGLRTVVVNWWATWPAVVVERGRHHHERPRSAPPGSRRRARRRDRPGVNLRALAVALAGDSRRGNLAGARRVRIAGLGGAGDARRPRSIR